jgi:hypothetical protein
MCSTSWAFVASHMFQRIGLEDPIAARRHDGSHLRDCASSKKVPTRSSLVPRFRQRGGVAVATD